MGDNVRAKVEEDSDYTMFKLDDPVKFLKKIKAVCYNYTGGESHCSIMLSSTRQVGNTGQGFKESTRDHIEHVRTRLNNFRNNLKKLMLAECPSYEQKDAG